MKIKSQKGFAHLGVILLLVIVAVIAFAGYKTAKNRSNNATVSSASNPAAAEVIPTIKNTAGLNTAESTLNSQNIDGDLNPDSLNQDVSSLL
jgi:glucan phosphoethanolaminetransferase (alkaline phosphatase superfamily)